MVKQSQNALKTSFDANTDILQGSINSQIDAVNVRSSLVDRRAE